MTSQLFGFHISPNGTSETQIREIARRSGSRTHTILHSAGLANAVYQESIAAGVEDPIIILRADWPDQEWWKAPFNDPDKFVRDRKPLVGSHLYLQYLNEPVVTNTAQLADLLDKCIQFMDACERHGVKGSVGGFADASLFQQAWVEAGLFDAFLSRAVDWTRAGHGVINHHDYSEGCPMANGGGKSEWDMLEPAKMQPASWPTAKDMQEPTPGSWLAFSAQDAEGADFDFEIATEAAKFLISERGLQPRYDGTRELFVETHGMQPMEWLMSHFIAFGSESNWTAMRYMWPLRRARKLKGRGYWALVGEYGPQDDMPHARVMGLSQQLEARAAGGRKLRGPLEQADFYAFWWPQWSREQAHMEILRWQARVIPDEVLGYTFFALNEDQEWRSFNYLRWAAFWPAFNALTDELRRSTPVTSPQPVPKPASAGTPLSVHNTSPDSYRVRSGPGTQYPQVGGIASKAEATIYPATKRAGGTHQWVWVEGGSGQPGWTADDGQFAPVQPVFGDPTVQLDVPFQTQRNTGVNNCGEAALTSLLNYWLTATGRPGQVMIEDVIASVDNDGGYASLAQLKTASAELGLVIEARANLALPFVRAELDEGRPLIALVERGKLPGTQDFYKFTGSHFVVVTGYGDNFVTLHDPLSLPLGPGEHLKVSDAAFLDAWHTTPGNSGQFQALVAPPDQWQPVTTEPPIDPDLYAAILEQSARLEAANNALVAAVQEHTLTVAEVIESLRAAIGHS